MPASELPSDAAPDPQLGSATSSNYPDLTRLGQPLPFPAADAAERAALLRYVREVALVYGPWQRWKNLYKRVEVGLLEAGPDAGEVELELLGALAARLDTAPLPLAKESAGQDRQPPVLRGSFGNMAVVGHRAYVVETRAGLRILDISDPLQPRDLGRYYAEGLAGVSWGTPVVDGSVVAILIGGNRLLVIDVADSAKPQQVGVFTVGYAHTMAVSHGYAYIADGGGITVFRLPQNEAANIEQIGRLEMSYPQAIVIAGQRAFVTSYSYRATSLHILDISDPTQLRTVGSLSNYHATHIIPVGNRLVTVGNGRLSVVDVTRTEHPHVLGAIKVDHTYYAAAVEGQAFVVNYNFGRDAGQPGVEVQAIDISHPASPRKMGSLPIKMVQSLAVAGNNLLLCGNDGLRVVDTSDPARLQPIGQQPSAKTFGYMKRRARRLLHGLQEVDPDRYVRLAYDILIESGGGRDALDLQTQWLTADILLGAGERYQQARHGRGGYRLVQPHFIRYSREERAPEAWDRHLDLVLQLWTHEHLPWQTKEAAWKIMRAAGREVPPVASESLARMALGNSPALILFATRRLAALLEQDVLSVSPEGAAAVVYASNPQCRRAALQHIEAATGLDVSQMNPSEAEAMLTWRARFMTCLALIIGLSSLANDTSAVSTGLTRRQRTAALLLAARFDLSLDIFCGDGLVPALPALLLSGEAPLREVGLGACRRMNVKAAVQVLPLLESVPDKLRNRAVEALCEGVRNGEPFDSDTALRLVRSPVAWMREAGWQLLAASTTPDATFRALWTRLWLGLRFEYLSQTDYNRRYQYDSQAGRWSRNGQYGTSVALETALGSDAALDTLARCKLNYKDLRLRSVLEQPLIPASGFVGLSIILPAPQVLKLIVEASGEAWTQWRSAWLRWVAHNASQLPAFWQAVRAALEPGADKGQALFNPQQVEILRQRVLQNADMAATFVRASASLPPDLLVQVIAEVPDAVWNGWRLLWLDTLRRDAVQREAFWRAVRQASGLLQNSQLVRRVLEDEEIVATFGLVEDDVLEADDPSFAPLLLTWLQAREARFARGDALLLTAATHSLPAVRDWGLARLQVLGLDVPSALRLLESGLPPSMEFGKRFFEAEPVGGPRELEFAVALSDSPRIEVRAYGRQYIEARAQTLFASGVLDRLAANPNPEMQGFLAERLLQQPEQSVDTQEFDRAVLRSRGRARRAKELVKRRLSKTRAIAAPANANLPVVTDADVNALLELARGRTPRDAEWAMQQLARLAAQGQAVEAVQIGEVSGV